MTVTHFDEAARLKYKTCVKALAFVEELAKGGRWVYCGGETKLGQSGRVICWWRAPGSSVYRILYGDLRIADAQSEPSTSSAPAPEGD